MTNPTKAFMAECDAVQARRHNGVWVAPRPISSIWLTEPMRENEWPTGAIVGRDGVTLIQAREQVLGEYSLLWFDVFNGDVLVSSFNARHVAEIHYTKEG